MKIEIPEDIDAIGVFSDVHGEYMNILAMQDCCPDIEYWVCLGDLVDKDVPMYNNQPSIRLAQKIGAQAILGNHEQKSINRRFSEYDDASREFLEALPDRIDIRFGSINLSAIHYIPLDPKGMKPKTKLEPLSDFHDPYCACFESGESDVYLVGHTHIQHDIKLSSTRIINPGSLAGKGEGERSFAIFSRSGECRFMSLGPL